MKSKNAENKCTVDTPYGERRTETCPGKKYSQTLLKMYKMYLNTTVDILLVSSLVMRHGYIIMSKGTIFKTK